MIARSHGGWTRVLPQPLTTRDGKIIRTLSDARTYIIRLGQRLRNQQHWTTAALAVLAAADHDGDIQAANEKVKLALSIDSKLAQE